MANNFYFNMMERIIKNGKANGNLDEAYVTKVINVYLAGGFISFEQYEQLMEMMK